MYAPESPLSNVGQLKDAEGQFLSSMKCESSMPQKAAVHSRLDKQLSIGSISPYSVLIGRGKACKDNVGNQRLEILAKTVLPQFADAADKDDKSKVVTYLIDSVHKNGGSFLKLVNGEYVEANMRATREKVGVVLRNLVGPEKYRSSCKSKVAARRERVKARRMHHGVAADSVTSSTAVQASSAVSSSSQKQVISIDDGSLDKLLSCDIIFDLPGDDGDISSLGSSQDFSLEDNDLESLGAGMWEL